ncbi:TrmH family RNA methyltransferase [Kribbia dieselivorans]|uniref:TrmH family RNA methyltransferase n=1 Tax=Kribbia dieselivorans TaxID=331526 RepID=UPI001FE1E0CA|nr:RNA methyltransferase [Kribbia dieselivorans]
MEELLITSAANPRLKSLVGLRRRRQREESGLTLIEGFEELELALTAGVAPKAVFYCPDLMLDPANRLAVIDAVRAGGAEVYRLGRAAFEKVAYREGPDGFLAVVASVTRSPRELELPPNALVLICQGVEKPGNLGAMLRTADAAGVAAVVACDPVTDWGNPNLVRSSKGTVFSVPVASGTTDETLGWLRERGVSLVAATPDTSTEHTGVDLTGPVAIAVGSEKYGLTDDLMARAAHRVRIPMVGKANSLNVATSAAIIIYEAVRQRSGGRRS